MRKHPGIKMVNACRPMITQRKDNVYKIKIKNVPEARDVSSRAPDVIPFIWHLEPLLHLLSLRPHFLPQSSCVLRYYHNFPSLLNGIYI